MIAIAIAVLVALAALVLFTTTRLRDAGRLSGETRRKDRSESPYLADPDETQRTGRDYERWATRPDAEPGTDIEPAPERLPEPYVPDPEVIGVTRRQFFNRSIVAMMGLGLSGFGAAVLAFLWPQLTKGSFGSKLTLGKVEDILQTIQTNRTPQYFPEGRVYINPYPKDAVAKAKKAYSSAVIPGMEAGVVALYQKCVHLGCRVPWCQTSQWFECPCHGSQYNRVGEKKGGPAPRGLDRFPVQVSGGSLIVDTGSVILGPPIGVNTTGQEAEGPHCINPGGAHH